MNHEGPNIQAHYSDDVALQQIAKNSTLPLPQGGVKNKAVWRSPPTTNSQGAPCSDEASMIESPVWEIRHRNIIRADDLDGGEAVIVGV